MVQVEVKFCWISNYYGREIEIDSNVGIFRVGRLEIYDLDLIN